MQLAMTRVRRRCPTRASTRRAEASLSLMVGLMIALVAALLQFVAPPVAIAQTNGAQADDGRVDDSRANNGRSDDGDAFVGDIPYVPTPQDVVETMLAVAQVGSSDYVIDLGSGDGRIVVTAASEFGAQGLGIDLDPKRVAEAVENARKAGVGDRVQFFQGDLYETDFSRATVLSMYLLPDINLALRSKVLALKPGTRVVSHDFDMGDWRPDHMVRMHSSITGYESHVYFWIVPAKMEGSWRWTADSEPLSLRVAQAFQQIDLKITGGKGTWQASDAVLRGDQVIFTTHRADGAIRVYHGRINGNTITGTVRDGAGEKPWRAQRAR